MAQPGWPGMLQEDSSNGMIHQSVSRINSRPSDTIINVFKLGPLEFSKEDYDRILTERSLRTVDRLRGFLQYLSYYILHEFLQGGGLINCI
jgi:hypothetical protein